MTTVFHAKPYGRFIKIKSNFRRKKLHITDQGSNFLGDSLRIKDIVRAPIQFKRDSLITFKDNFSSRTDPFTLTSIAPELLDRSSKTSKVFLALKTTSHFLLQFIVPCRSDSDSEANSRIVRNFQEHFFHRTPPGDQF